MVHSSVNHLCMRKERIKASELWHILINVSFEILIVAKNVEVIEKSSGQLELLQEQMQKVLLSIC